jgi:hypothetical protein
LTAGFVIRNRIIIVVVVVIIIIIIIIIVITYIPYNYTKALGILKLNTLQGKSTFSWDRKRVFFCLNAQVSMFPLAKLVTLLCLALQAKWSDGRAPAANILYGNI